MSDKLKAGPTGIDETVFQSASNPDVFSFPEKVGPNLSQCTNSVSDTTPPCLFLSRCLHALTLFSPYAHVSKLIQPHYDHFGPFFLEKGLKNTYTIANIV